ncbi:MAG: hypothetical protein HWN80_10630 [Candidatus Lokiarchaeota archaeon]|nr:hypothetical protein [Candidatus Lokiarchaeota archaeon]
MTESKKIIYYELEQSLSEALKEKFIEEAKIEPVKIPFTEEEPGQIDKERILKRWKKSEGYYYLNPNKFLFSLKDL